VEFIVSTTFCSHRSTSHIPWMRLYSKSVQRMVRTIFGMQWLQVCKILDLASFLVHTKLHYLLC